jgi:periplasmic divalent cation tolerance protein
MSMKTEKMAVVLSNFASSQSAASVLRILMQEGICSCGNIFAPHRAFYYWDGKIQDEEETAVLFKAPFEKRDALLERLRALHPYDLPGLIVLDADVNADYALWLATPQAYDNK